MQKNSRNVVLVGGWIQKLLLESENLEMEFRNVLLISFFCKSFTVPTTEFRKTSFLMLVSALQVSSGSAQQLYF